MPIRIKPVYDLGVCTLDLDSIKGICKLIAQDFTHAKFSAEDDIWEVYDEDHNGFISAILNRETLDSFVVDARDSNIATASRVINIIFNKYQATVKFSGSDDQEHWFEHFLIDLRKHLRPPEFRQYLLAIEQNKVNYDPVPRAVVGLSKPFDNVSWFFSWALRLHEARYSLIVIRKKSPSPLIESVKANLISNFI